MVLDSNVGRVRLLFIRPVPRFAGFRGDYGPFEPGDTCTFEGEPFVSVLVFRGFAVAIPLSSSASKTKKSEQSSILYWVR